MKRRETNRRGKKRERSISDEVERWRESERDKEWGGDKGSEGRVTWRP